MNDKFGKVFLCVAGVHVCYIAALTVVGFHWGYYAAVGAFVVSVGILTAVTIFGWMAFAITALFVDLDK